MNAVCGAERLPILTKEQSRPCRLLIGVTVGHIDRYRERETIIRLKWRVKFDGLSGREAGGGWAWKSRTAEARQVGEDKV